MILRYLVFFAVVLVVFGGAHALVGWRLASWMHLRAPIRYGLWAFLALAGILSFAGQILARQGVAAPIAWGGAYWMGLLFLLFSGVLVGEVLGWGAVLAQLPARVVQTVRIAPVVLGLFGSFWAVRNALADPLVHEIEVPVAGLAPAFDGYRLAHVTDTHLGPILKRPWMERLAARIDSAQPDLVVHTGDLVDGPVERVGADVEPWGRLRGRDGALFVTGNHDVYSGARSWAAHVASLGVVVLRNSAFVVRRGQASLVVGGIPDLQERGFGTAIPDPAMAFHNTPEGARILLAHQPIQARDAQGLGIALQLSGHTHGGQIWPFGFLVRLAQPVVSGLGRVGDVPVFVSKGAGFWGPPLRLFAFPEVPILVLRAARAEG